MPDFVMDSAVEEDETMKDENYDWNDTDYYGGQFIDQGEASLIAILYLSYMPLCCFVGLTGNCMVLILIRLMNSKRFLQ